VKQKQDALLAQQKQRLAKQEQILEYGEVRASPSKSRLREQEEEERQNRLDLAMIAAKEEEMKKIQEPAARRKEPSHVSTGSGQKFSTENMPHLTHNLAQVISKQRDLKPVPQPGKAYEPDPVESCSLREMLQKEKELALKRQAAVHRGEGTEDEGGGGGSAIHRGMPMPWDEGDDTGEGEDEDDGMRGYTGLDPETQQWSPGGYVGSSTEDAVPAPMPEAYYQGVDQFLRSGPPPSLSGKCCMYVCVYVYVYEYVYVYVYVHEYVHVFVYVHVI